MDKRLLVFLVFAVIAVLAIGSIAVAGKGKKGGRAKKPACGDKIDNDGDGYCDFLTRKTRCNDGSIPGDPGCSSKRDTSELNPNIECDDGIDNDGDGAVDYHDGGCTGPEDDDETNCGDGVCEGGETSQNCPADCGPGDSCDDTDGGIVLEIQGTVSGYRYGYPYEYTDYCNSTTLLTEFYCNGVSPNWGIYGCNGTCNDGACV